MLLQKKSQFQNIPFVDLFHPETVRLTNFLTNFWSPTQLQFLSHQQLFYLYSFFIEISAFIRVQKLFRHFTRRVSAVGWIMSKKPLQKVTNSSIIVERRRALNFQPFYFEYRKLFYKTSWNFTRFWLQRRHRHQGFTVSGVKLPHVQVLRRRRKKKLLFKRRKHNKLFLLKLRKLAVKTKYLWKKYGKNRLWGRIKVRIFLKSSRFKKVVLQKLTKYILLVNDLNLLTVKRGSNLLRTLQPLLKEDSFVKLLFDRIRKFIFLYLVRVASTRVPNSSRLLRTRRSTPEPLNYCLKNPQPLNYSNVTPLSTKVVDNSIPIKWNSFGNNILLSTRKFLHNFFLQQILLQNNPETSQLGDAFNFRTRRGYRLKLLRLPRMTNYFTLRTRRFNLGLLTPMFILMLKQSNKKKSLKSLPTSTFEARYNRSVSRAASRKLFKNNRLGNSALWTNRFLKKKVLQSKRLRRSFFFKKKYFKDKPKFRRFFYRSIRSLSIRCRKSSQHLLKTDRREGRCLLSRGFRKEPHLPSRLKNSLLKVYRDNSNFRLKTALINPLVETIINLTSTQEGIGSPLLNPPLIYSQRYLYLRYRPKRNRRSPRWRRVKRAWYTLQRKFYKKPFNRLFKPNTLALANIKGVFFKTMIRFRITRNLRLTFFKKPHLLRRKLSTTKSLFRRAFHDFSIDANNLIKRTVSRRRKLRRRRRTKANRLLTNFWSYVSTFSTLDETQSSGVIYNCWSQNLNTLRLELKILNHTSLMFKFTNYFQRLLPKMYRNVTLRNQPQFQSFLNKSFILSEVGFLYLQTFTLVLNPRNFSSLKAAKYSFYDLMFLKRSILKTKKPTYFFQKKSNTPFLNTNTLEYRSSKLFAGQTFNGHSQNPLNVLNCSFDSVLTHEFDVNLLEGEDDYYIRIKRIRFKPGYPRLWREARSDFNKMFGLNFRYQHRLTQYLTRYSRHASALKSSFLDLKLKTILLRVWWAFDPVTVADMTTHRLVFLNGNIVYNSNKLLFKGDLLQLTIHLKYYIIHRWLLNWYYFKSNRKARLAKSKFKRVQQAQMKQRSYLLPNWLLRMRLVDLEIPRFIEVDFFSLSALILYSPQYSLDYQLIDTLDSRFEIYAMYNWKYIN